METRANFILIGAFTLAAMIGTLVFFIWLAAVQIDRQYASYAVLFEDVAGLDAAGAVTYNGINVGQVIALRIHAPDPSKVLATIQIDAETPISTNTVAQLQSQGVTGVAFISLSTGDQPPGPITQFVDDLPVIASRRSTVQVLVEDAPDFLAESLVLLRQVQALTGPDNQAYVADILRNLASSSGQLDQALQDFSQISGTVRDATDQIALFTDRLETIGGAVETTLTRTDTALAAVQQAFLSADRVLTEASPAIGRIEGSFALVEQALRDSLPAILAQVQDTLARTGAAVVDLQARSAQTLAGIDSTTTLLNARLIALETTLTEAEIAFDAVTTAADKFEILIDGDVAEFLAEARAAVALIDAVMVADVPVLVADIRRALRTGADALTVISADLTGFTGSLGPLTRDAQAAIRSTGDVMAQAQGTLAALERSLAGADGALAAAQTAFGSATALMQTDLAPVFADLRRASDQIGTAVQDVTADLPAMSADLRALIARADAVMAQVQTAVAQSAPGLTDFAATGLPELARLGAEARGLVSTLNTLLRRIDNDPAGFLLDNRVPEYRR